MSKKVKRTPSKKEKPPAAATPDKTEGGRPTKYTLEKQTAICGYVQEGLAKDEAARLVGINPDTLYEWQKSRPEFSDAVKEAEAHFERFHIALIASAARDRTNAEGLITRRGSWVASAWLLERKYPNRYGQRWAGELTGKGGKPLIPDAAPKVDLSKFTDEQLKILGTNLIPIINGTAAPAAANGNGNGSPG